MLFNLSLLVLMANSDLNSLSIKLFHLIYLSIFLINNFFSFYQEKALYLSSIQEKKLKYNNKLINQ